MKDYRNMSCAACGVSFDSDSDIVICPECGAPHHRECWKEQGHCACEARHADGYEWEPERIVIGGTSKADEPDPGDASASSAPETVICPMCGRETAKGQGYCERCGYYMQDNEKDSFSPGVSLSSMEEFFQFDEAESVEGVPAGDIKRFVGGMWIYYIPRFLRLSRKKASVSFNFTAFLAHGLWFIARKMYLPGILLMLTVAGISAYQVYFSSVMEQLSGNRLLVGSMVYMLLSGLEGLIMLLSGLFGNKLYLRFCTKKIRKINADATKANASAEQFNKAIEAEGGVGVLQAFSVGLCYLAVLYILEHGFLF